MKKVLLSILLLIVPIYVFANISAGVDEDTQTTQWEIETTTNAKNICMAEEDRNISSELSHATNGYYLYCIEISCVNSKNVHTIENPLSNVLSCANGNTDPKTTISSSGASGIELRSGATCSNTGIYAYATEKIYYDCSRTSGDVVFTPPTTTIAPTTTQKPTTTTAPTTTTTTRPVEPTTTIEPTTTAELTTLATTVVIEETTTISSPKTGVEDYFLTLGITIVTLITGIYIIDKKNIFKKI